MSSNTSGEGDIRRKLIEADLVDCIVHSTQFLFNTDPVCLWFLTKSKIRGHRNRAKETLFIDARKVGRMETRKNKVLTLKMLIKLQGLIKNGGKRW